MVEDLRLGVAWWGRWQLRGSDVIYPVSSRVLEFASMVGFIDRSIRGIYRAHLAYEETWLMDQSRCLAFGDPIFTLHSICKGFFGRKHFTAD